MHPDVPECSSTEKKDLVIPVVFPKMDLGWLADCDLGWLDASFLESWAC